jgi:hypothetical protein
VEQGATTVVQAREAETDLAVRAAWLSYVGGYTQEQIAQRLGVSRVKVHRLSSLAQDLGFVKVSIEHELVSTVVLENRLIERYGLTNCILVPTMEGGDAGPGGRRRWCCRRRWEAPLSLHRVVYPGQDGDSRAIFSRLSGESSRA